MTSLIKLSSLSLLPLFLFGVFPASLQADKMPIGRLNTQEGYYTLQDYKKVKKFDVHIHVNTAETYFMELAKKDNFQFLVIVDDRPFGLPMAGQQQYAIQHLKNFPELMNFATTFSVKDWDQANWTQTTIASLKQSIAKGARAVKIWKNIGMDLRDKNGKFVMLDHPRLDPVFDYLEKEQIPLIGHNGEPRDCWLPLAEMTFSKAYYGAHPEYHMFLHPEYPSYDDQIMARDNRLKRNPRLKFVGAHLGSLEWSLDELALRLDKFPQMSVDLSRMSNLQLHALKNWQKTHDFFIKYQDRLIYGSDKAINSTAQPVEMQKNLHEAWMRDWKFYVSKEKINLAGFGELKGLNLPKEVVDKIYFKNAQKWLKFNF